MGPARANSVQLKCMQAQSLCWGSGDKFEIRKDSSRPTGAIIRTGATPGVQKKTHPHSLGVAGRTLSLEGQIFCAFFFKLKDFPQQRYATIKNLRRTPTSARAGETNCVATNVPLRRDCPGVCLPPSKRPACVF